MLSETGKVPVLEDEESVAVRAELIVLLERCLVCSHHILITAECRNRHEHCGTWSVEV